MSANKAQRYLKHDLDRQPGEVARLRVLKGPDQGSVYILKSSTAVLGRGEDVDVRISDLKSSRAHARLDYTTSGWMVSDLGSANGIFFQGEYIRKFPLKSGEHFSIGETILEFLGSHESTQVLMAPMRSGREVDTQDRSLSNQKVKVKSYAQPTVLTQPQQANAKKLNPRTLLMLAALAGIYFMMDEGDPQGTAPKAAAKKEKKKDERDVASEDSEVVDRSIRKTAEQYYRQGFREYRERNYLRAKQQFELALQVNPNHELSRHYLGIAEQEIIKEIKKMINAAQKAVIAGRLKEAKGYYQAAMRLMYQDQTNPDYIECEDAIKKINEDLEGMLNR